MPFLHVHKRRVPTQNVYRSVTAIMTSKSCLAFARFYVHGSASFIWHVAAAGLNVTSPREAGGRFSYGKCDIFLWTVIT